MKKIFLLTAMLFGMASVFAQDIIRLKHGGDIKVIVQEIGKEEVLYKKFDRTPDAPNNLLKKSEILCIRYATGSMICFAEGIKTILNNTWSGLLSSGKGTKSTISIKYDWADHKFSIKYDDCNEGELFLMDYNKKEVIFYENLPNGCMHEGRIVFRKIDDRTLKVTKSGPDFSKAVWFTGYLNPLN